MMLSRITALTIKRFYQPQLITPVQSNRHTTLTCHTSSIYKHTFNVMYF